MSNLTGLQNGVFNSLQLIDDTTGDATEVRQLFLQGSLEQSIPSNPQNNQVLSIPGLLPELNARQLISNSYSRTEVDTIIQNNPGPKGDKGAKGAGGSKGIKGEQGPSSTGTKGQKGEQGSLGQKGEQGLGSKGQKGSQGTQGAKGDGGLNGVNGVNGTNGSKGQKGDQGLMGISITGSKGQKGELGTQGQKGEAGSGGLTTTQSTWLNHAIPRIGAHSTGVSDILLSSAAGYFGIATLTFATAYLQIKTAAQACINIYADKSTDFFNHIRTSGRLSVGSVGSAYTPLSTLEVRDGTIEIADSGHSNVNGITWSSNRAFRHEIGAIRCVDQGSYNGDLIFYSQTLTWPNSIPAQERMRIRYTGNVGVGTSFPAYKLQVAGSFAATSKSFDIPHQSKGGNWRLAHCCVETDNQGSTLYKRTVECTEGNNFLELPGWFEWLCENPVCFTSSVKHFGNSWAEVSGRTLQICTTKAGKYNVLIFSERRDAGAKEVWAGVEYEAEETTT